MSGIISGVFRPLAIPRRSSPGGRSLRSRSRRTRAIAPGRQKERIASVLIDALDHLGLTRPQFGPYATTGEMTRQRRAHEPPPMTAVPGCSVIAPVLAHRARSTSGQLDIHPYRQMANERCQTASPASRLAACRGAQRESRLRTRRAREPGPVRSGRSRRGRRSVCAPRRGRRPSGASGPSSRTRRSGSRA